MVIKKHELNVIEHNLNLSHSTVPTILKNRERICKAMEGSIDMKSNLMKICKN